MCVINVENLLVGAQVLFDIRESILGRNPMNVLNVGRPLVRAQISHQRETI